MSFFSLPNEIIWMIFGACDEPHMVMSLGRTCWRFWDIYRAWCQTVFGDKKFVDWRNTLNGTVVLYFKNYSSPTKNVTRSFEFHGNRKKKYRNIHVQYIVTKKTCYVEQRVNPTWIGKRFKLK